MDQQQNQQKPHHAGKKPYHGKRRPPYKRGQDRNRDNRRVNDAVAMMEEGIEAVEELEERVAPSQTQQPKKKQQSRPQNDRKKPQANQPASTPAQPVGADNQPSEESAKKNNRSRQQTPNRVSRGTTAPKKPQDLPSMDNLLIDDRPEELERMIVDEYNAEEIQRILDHDIFARPEVTPIPDPIPEGKVVVAGIRFRPGGKTYFFAPGDIDCTVGKYAIVETARGVEFGEVCIANCLVDESIIYPPLRPVLRLANAEDIEQNRQNHAREEEATRIGKEKIAEHKLDMKLVSVQYTFDCSKLLFYFTSEGRVDFRELVKDLASVFRLRIELRQIGIRDEARMLGGLGACGRALCCSTFLTDFGQVSMKMAKDQGLALNSTKISGCCGRLMCCLRYEHETYLSLTRELPTQGTVVGTPDGMGVVTEVYPLEGAVKVAFRGENAPAPKKFTKAEITLPNHRTTEEATNEAAETEPDTLE